MQLFDPSLLKQLYIPPKDSHKGQNGKLLLIGGSRLFHAAALWPLTVASRIVDMVYFASVSENNEIVTRAKEEFRNGIVIRRNQIDDYIQEADCVLIGPGLPRPEGREKGDEDTQELTEKLLKKYPQKKWVIDGGSLQVIQPEILPPTSIITPHRREFEQLFNLKFLISNFKLNPNDQNIQIQNKISEMAKKYNVVILVKGEEDIVCSPAGGCVRISGGNAGMTKGGTGDVLAGLVAALYCKNDAFLSAAAGAYINKKAGESLFKRVGYYFNSSDLANEIPRVVKELL